MGHCIISGMCLNLPKGAKSRRRLPPPLLVSTSSVAAQSSAAALDCFKFILINKSLLCFALRVISFLSRCHCVFTPQPGFIIGLWCTNKDFLPLWASVLQWPVCLSEVVHCSSRFSQGRLVLFKAKMLSGLRTDAGGLFNLTFYSVIIHFLNKQKYPKNLQASAEWPVAVGVWSNDHTPKASSWGF